MDRVLLLLPTTTYRTQAFLEAAHKMGVDVVCASEKPSTLETQSPSSLLTLDFRDLATAAARVVDFSRTHPVHAVVGVDDLTVTVAAAIAERLGLPTNPTAAVSAARNKHELRRWLARAGVPGPGFRAVALHDDPAVVAAAVTYPCVLKPLALSASRGVIRADSAAEFVAAFHRIAAILRSSDVTVAGEAADHLLVETYIPGAEVALEGLLDAGTLHTLAIFDKPDPLEGPFFEETIYVTPSRLPRETLRRVVAVTAQACQALGLVDGPVHAELRVNDQGAFVLELAARSIGGLCSRVLRFGTGVSLEELILNHALGRKLQSLERETGAAGVMMIPVPRAGRLRAVRGQEEAAAVPGVEEIAITAHRGQELVPLPEGWQYPGFIFARADSPEQVEKALREAYGRLVFEID